MGNYLFGLDLQDAFLPSQTIEQGKFDIMRVLRNIPDFVDKYKYNIFTQTFLEITTDAKEISSIGIKQLSDSIKTHGLGILSTTVNAFYKFLAKKINLFNKFLYDELINSLLVREKNFMRQESEKDDYDGFYPYHKAEGLYK
jgi:WASH complex subunit 7